MKAYDVEVLLFSVLTFEDLGVIQGQCQKCQILAV